MNWKAPSEGGATRKPWAPERTGYSKADLTKHRLGGGPQGTVPLPAAVRDSSPEPPRNNVGLGLCAQQGASLAGESPAAPWQGGCVDKKPGRPAALGLMSQGGQGVHREMESEGHASNLRAIAEA
jgi:hypothetical protein